MAIIAGNTWIKLFLKMRITQTFGPLFKVMINMIIQLFTFSLIWLLDLLVFSSISILLFGQLPGFKSFNEVLVYYFESSLGNWDANKYCEVVEFTGEKNELLCTIGMWYTIIFLIINNVLLLNLVIALMSAVYTKYEEKMLGLYYESLVALFPTMDYEEKYGAVVCASAPLNLMILPFWWVTLLPLKDEFLIKYNKFLCYLLYFPIALTCTAIFMVMTTMYAPVAYISHLLALIKTITDADETMDELSEKL